MAILILVTNKKVGKSFLYSGLNHKGKKKIVSTYRMTVTNESGSVEEFPVTRDTMATVFGKKNKCKYDEGGEAPPNKSGTPYRAHIRTDGSKGFRLELYEP